MLKIIIIIFSIKLEFMKHIYLQLIILLVFNASVLAQTKTIQEQLGYDKNAKLLIIHADDIGVTHSENVGTITAIEKGVVNSGSIMVPCPWFPEIVAYAKENPQLDLGIHLTLTSEWKYYKWRPIAPLVSVPGLVTNNGFMYANPQDVVKNANLEEIENELRLQIQMALDNGIDVTHLDSHMGTLFYKPEYIKVYKELGKEFKLPVLLSHEDLKGFSAKSVAAIENDDFTVDHIYTATPKDYKAGMSNYYNNIISSLKPGLSVLLIHTALDNEEMKAVTIDHPEWGAAWRQADLDYFTSTACENLLEKENIQLVTWREIRDKVIRK